MTTALTSRDVCRDITATEIADLLNPQAACLAAADKADSFRRWHAFVLGGAIVAASIFAWFQFVKPYFAWSVV